MANKTKALHARATMMESAALREIARSDGVKPSEKLREMVRAEAKARGLWDGLVAEIQGGKNDEK